MKMKSKNFKNWMASLMALCFLFTISLSGCSNNKKEAESNEETTETELMDSTVMDASQKAEHPSDGSEHPSDGHEHPSDDADSTSTDAAEHPTEGGEHPKE